MSNDQKSAVVLYLERNRLYVAEAGKIFMLDLPESVVSDLDLVSKDSLRVLIYSLIDKNKIAPSEFYLILAPSVCFIKELAEREEAKKDVEYQNFCNAVPFNYIVCRLFQTKEGAFGISANRETIEGVAEIFEEKKFNLIAVAPAAVLGNLGTKRQFDIETVKFIHENYRMVITQSLYAKENLPSEEGKEQPVKSIFGKMGRQAILVGVFLVLLVILLIFLFVSRR